MLVKILRPFIYAACALGALAIVVPSGAQLKGVQPQPTTVPGSSPAPRTITLDEAIGVGLTNSKSLRIAAEAVNRARGRVSESRSGLLPTVTSNVVVTHLDQGSTITFPGPNGQPQTIPIILQDQKSVGVTAALPIDIAGQIRTAVQANQFQEIATRLDYNRARNQTVLDIKNAYYDVLRDKAFLTVTEQAKTNAQDRLRIAEANLRAGTGTRFDVLRAQTEVANAEQNRIVAQNKVNLAVATLNNVLGLDQNTPLQVTEAAETGEPARDFNQAVAEAYRIRPESLQSDALVRAAEKGLYIAKRSQMPSLGLSWNFSYQPDQGGFAPRETSWNAVAQLTLPLYEAGLARARTQQARADVNTQKLNKQVTLDTVALDVRQAYLALVEAEDRLTVTTAALTEAQEQYRLARVRFEAGVTAVPGASPLLEISDAQTALTTAQTNQVNARYDVQNSHARLDRAIGRYAYDATAKPGFVKPTPIK